MSHALLVYPAFPPSYWGYTYALDFVGKKSAMPPLGLLTVAAMFPEHNWHLKVVDMNVSPLTDTDLAWADYVFTSTMIVQKQSFYEVVKRCNQRNLPVIAGGPHPTSYQAEIQREAGGMVSHVLSGEVEHIFQDFLVDLRRGTAKAVYELRIDILRGEGSIFHRLAWFCRPAISMKIRSACYEMPCKSPKFTQIRGQIRHSIANPRLDRKKYDSKFSILGRCPSIAHST
jgi:radical SAM superfamily enzyme YgiQ (UPF0313 family)